MQFTINNLVDTFSKRFHEEFPILGTFRDSCTSNFGNTRQWLSSYHCGVALTVFIETFPSSSDSKGNYNPPFTFNIKTSVYIVGKDEIQREFNMFRSYDLLSFRKIPSMLRCFRDDLLSILRKCSEYLDVSEFIKSIEEC